MVIIHYIQIQQVLKIQQLDMVHYKIIQQESIIQQMVINH
jgi:hypothetical protein